MKIPFRNGKEQVHSNVEECWKE